MFSLLKKFTIQFSNLNIFHWLIFSTFTWILLYGSYLKCIKLLFRRVGLDKRDGKYLMDTIWQLCFTAVSLPVVLSYLGDGGMVDQTDWGDKLSHQLYRCKIHEDDVPIPGVKTVFVLHWSFSVHNFVNTWFYKGFKNLEFLQKQVFLAVFTLTYYSKCPLLGFCVLFLVQRTALLELLTKLCSLLAGFTCSASLTCAAKALCGYCLVLWCGTFLYTVPRFLMLSKTINSDMMKAEMNMLIVLDVLLWIYLTTTLLNSMFSRMMLSISIPNKNRPRTLHYFLFGCDPWLRMKFTSSAESKRESTSCTQVEKPKDPHQKNCATLVQTIRCSIVLKRKLRRMREAKARQQAAVDSSQCSEVKDGH